MKSSPLLAPETGFFTLSIATSGIFRGKCCPRHHSLIKHNLKAKHIMASYDSDDSLSDDDQSGTSTNVLLGYATKEPVDDAISQLGGEPVCLTHFTTSSLYSVYTNISTHRSHGSPLITLLPPP